MRRSGRNRPPAKRIDSQEVKPLKSEIPFSTHSAAHPCFNYYGRWHIDQTAVTINSGSLLEFAYLGNACRLLFDIEGFAHFPAVFVQLDNGPIVRTALSREVDKVAVTPAYPLPPAGEPPFATVSSRHHLARCWIAANSLYLTEAVGTQWSTLVGGCRFVGVSLEGELLPLPYASRQIEFLGDSITQGLRLLFTGTDDDTALQIPYANWPQYVADLLGMKPVVTGFGGQGLTSVGTSGAPPAPAAFPYCYDRTPWTPPVKPQVVVIYHGTNDPVSPEDFELSYQAYLVMVRSAYPSARIFAVCPHNVTRYAPAIENAVNASGDERIAFLDYSSGVISLPDTCDGCHLNPGGAVKLAVRLADDIGCTLVSFLADTGKPSSTM